jgi:hypothetical protein
MLNPMAAGVEFRFTIDAYSPETMPMARLAEYIAQLAIILGEVNAVHLVRLEGGGATAVHKVEREAIPKVRDRAASVRRGDGPLEAIRANRKINQLLREDNGVGVLSEDAGEIIRFPGRELSEEKFESVEQQAAIDGEVIQIGGSNKIVPILLQSEGQELSGCWAPRAVAKRLAARLFEPVRLFGRGRWTRDSEGKWALDHFTVDSFQELRDEPLSKTIAGLRAIAAGWKDDSVDELLTLRHGETTNGGD